MGNRFYVLVFLEHATRRLHIAGVPSHPTRDWATQQARNLGSDLWIRLQALRFLPRDRDGKYSPAFDVTVQARRDQHPQDRAPGIRPTPTTGVPENSDLP